MYMCACTLTHLHVSVQCRCTPVHCIHLQCSGAGNQVINSHAQHDLRQLLPLMRGQRVIGVCLHVLDYTNKPAQVMALHVLLLVHAVTFFDQILLYLQGELVSSIRLLVAQVDSD